MAVAYASVSNTTYASRTNTEVAKPTGVESGDLILFWVNVGAASTVPSVTNPEGLTLAPGTWPVENVQTALKMKSWLYYKVAGGSEPSNYKFTHTTASSQIVAVRVTGAGSEPKLQGASNLGTLNTSKYGSVTTSAPESLILLFEHDWGDKAAGSLTVPTGSTPTFTKRLDVTLCFVATGTLASAGATGEKTMTNANNNSGQSSWSTGTLAIEPPAGGKAWKVELSDTVAISDSLGKATAKGLADSVTVGDGIAKVSSKPFADSVGVSDALSKRPTKAAADSISLSDGLTKRAGKGLSDSVSVADALAKATSKSSADSVSVMDSMTKSTGKSLVDTVAVTDSIAKQPRKGLADSVTVSDGLAKRVSKGLADSVAIADSLGKRLGKLLGDAVSLVDEVLARIFEREVPLAERPTTLELAGPGGTLSVAAWDSILEAAAPQTELSVLRAPSAMRIASSVAGLDPVDPGASLIPFDPRTELDLNG